MTREQSQKLLRSLRSVEDSCGDARLLLAAPIPDWSEIADLLSDAWKDLKRADDVVHEQRQESVAADDRKKGTTTP